MRINTVIWIVLVVIGLFSLAIGFALVWHIWWLAISGLLGVVATLIIRSYNDDIDYTLFR